VSQGLDNLEVIVENSRRIAEVLGGLNDAALSDERLALEESVAQLGGLRDKFFMNTVAAVPATKVCLTGSEKVLSALEEAGGDTGDAALKTVKQALGDLSEKIEELLDKAEMRGTTLT